MFRRKEPTEDQVLVVLAGMLVFELCLMAAQGLYKRRNKRRLDELRFELWRAGARPSPKEKNDEG